MRMKATVTGKALASTLVVSADDWRSLGNALRLRLITRTRGQGVDADGSVFAPYSEGYKLAKAKKGGMIGGGRVNLTGAGAGAKMLDAIAVLSTSATRNPRLVLGFALADKDRIAHYHMGEGRVDRLFFALSDEDEEYCMSYLRQRLAKRA
jgi:hypothetical protein